MTHQTLLKTLIESFSPQNLTAFFREKNRDFKPATEILSALKDTQFVQGEKLGYIPFNDFENLGIYTLQVNHDLKERSGKKVQYDFAKKILKETDEDAGIFVFYDATGNFRFSLVFANYLGKVRDYSNFRRFTYYVSPQLTNKTFLQRVGEADFNSLETIKEAFSVEKVTKDFYQEISYWYFWACQKSKFPEAAEKDPNGRQESIIRLITRLIFIWFMREKGLIPSKLFEKSFAQKALTKFDDQSSSYYLAILQNLFFATLNTPKKERQFRSETRGYKGYNPDFNNQYVYRYHALFNKPEELPTYFEDIPFLNGGLFDCLDDKMHGYYIDGFTESAEKNRPSVPNELFFSPEVNADFNAELGTSNRNYKVEGLLNILSRYNFTIDENTVDDKDVALDPEMLGRVFENLLASFNPETSTTARKATGSYYTPREIVDYMVDESLKSYLRETLSEISDLEKKLDWLFSDLGDENPFSSPQTSQIIKAIEDVRIVDPAVGSGAFPMGALHRMVSILTRLDPGSQLWQQAQLDATENIPDPQIREQVQESIRNYFKEKNPDYGRKLFLIQKCIYGVDLQPIAVEIAKLRFFISLLVEETVEKDKDNWGIEPLPNLDFKIMQGNSLISVFQGIDFSPNAAFVTKAEGLFAEQDEKAVLIKKFQNKKEVYQSESDHNKKRDLQEEIDQILIDLVRLNTLSQHADYARELERIDQKYAPLPASKAREEAINAEKEKVSARMGINLAATQDHMRQHSTRHWKRDFFPWSLYFAEVFTEKRGFDIVLGNPPYIGESGNKELFLNVRKANLKEYYLGKMDYFYFFFHLAIDLCNNSGYIAFISTNYFLTATGAYKLRKDLHARTTIKKLVNFNELKIFETALGQHNLISVFQKGVSLESEAESYITKRRGYFSPETLSYILSGDDKLTEYAKLKQNDLFTGPRLEMQLRGTGGANKELLESILSKISTNGIPLDNIASINQGLASGANKVTRRNINNIQGNSKLGDGIFVLKKSEVEKLSLTDDEKKAVKPYYKNSDIKKWTTSSVPNLFVLYLDRESPKHPSIIKHLKQFKNILSNRREVENGVIEWWQLQWPRSESIYNTEKIVVPQRSVTNTFGYNEIPWYASTDVYFITSKLPEISLKYVLALLNSKTYYLWLAVRGKRKGETLELFQTPLSQVPIPKISLEEQEPFIKRVDEILALCKSRNQQKQKGDHSELSRLENEIDELVFRLFDFTEAEIEYIEKAKSEGQ